MRPTEILMQEHRVIEQVLDCLQQMVERCDREGRLEAEPARQAIDFFRQFADRCHHGKEEERLFPLMHRRGFPADQGPVAVMKHEHEQGRAAIRGMEEAIPGAAEGRPEACQAWMRHARGYLRMLREHIQKEDHCLFPMADQAFSAADQTSLSEQFEQVERDEIGADLHRTYLDLADALADRYGVAKHRSTSASKPGARPPVAR